MFVSQIVLEAAPHYTLLVISDNILVCLPALLTPLDTHMRELPTPSSHSCFSRPFRGTSRLGGGAHPWGDP